MHEVLVNRLEGLSLPRKSVVRLTDRPDMTLDVYRGRKTTTQQQQLYFIGRKVISGPVVQSIVTLTSSLRGQLFKCFTTLYPNTLILFVEKDERSFCSAKASLIFSTKNIGEFQILTFEISTKH